MGYRKVLTVEQMWYVLKWYCKKLRKKHRKKDT